MNIYWFRFAVLLILALVLVASACGKYETIKPEPQFLPGLTEVCSRGKCEMVDDLLIGTDSIFGKSLPKGVFTTGGQVRLARSEVESILVESSHVDLGETLIALGALTLLGGAFYLDGAVSAECHKKVEETHVYKNCG